jgi:hypothetical protein
MKQRARVALVSIIRAHERADWVDAGVGAAAMVGLGLLVASASIVALRRRRAPGGLDDQAMPTAP